MNDAQSPAHPMTRCIPATQPATLARFATSNTPAGLHAGDIPDLFSYMHSEGAIVNLPSTLGQLRTSEFSAELLRNRRVKDEMRDNLIQRLRSNNNIFPGIIGYDDTVVPQIVNAVLSRHNFILLGLRGQAKSRI